MGQNQIIMEKLQELISKCNGSVYVGVNVHRDANMSISEYILQISGHSEEKTIDEIGVNGYRKMISLNTVVVVRFSPNTPVGFYLNMPVGSYQIIHYDLQQALDRALSIVNDKPFVAKDEKLIGNYVLLDIKNDAAAKKAAKCYAMAIKDEDAKTSIEIIKALNI